MSLATLRARRQLLKDAAVVASGLFAAPLVLGQSSPDKPAQAPTPDEPEVTPVEDLMREHGVLNRILLVYDDVIRRIDTGVAVPPEPLAKAADLVRTFVEDYHEKLEEEQLFPRFEGAGRLAELVGVLRAQHRAGRRLTDKIRQAATAATFKNADERRALADALRSFVRMYRPHEAREDTVLFPALHFIVNPGEYDALGDSFEDKEHALFGADGFEKIVDEVATIEKQLGLYELAQFTPRP